MSPGCPDFCKENPSDLSCPNDEEEDKCKKNPKAEGCDEFCKENPDHESCKEKEKC